MTSWFLQLRSVVKMLKIDGIEAFMPILLKDDAYAIDEHLSEKDKESLDAIEEALERAFSPSMFTAYGQKINYRWNGESVDVFLANLKTFAKLARVNENSVRNAFVMGLPADVSRMLQAIPKIECMPLADIVQISRAMMSSRVQSIERVNIADSKEKRCSYCDKTGHVVERCFKKLGTKCWLCYETNHISRVCPNKTLKNELGVTQTPVCTPLNK